MDSFILHGGQRLKGKIEISGSKNSRSADPCRLPDGQGENHPPGVPRLSDIDSMCKLIGELGCHVYRHESPATVGDMPALDGPLDIDSQR